MSEILVNSNYVELGAVVSDGDWLYSRSVITKSSVITKALASIGSEGMVNAAMYVVSVTVIDGV